MEIKDQSKVIYEAYKSIPLDALENLNPKEVAEKFGNLLKVENKADKKTRETLMSLISLSVKVAHKCTEDEFEQFLIHCEPPPLKLTDKELESMKGGWAGLFIGGFRSALPFIGGAMAGGALAGSGALGRSFGSGVGDILSGATAVAGGAVAVIGGAAGAAAVAPIIGAAAGGYKIGQGLNEVAPQIAETVGNTLSPLFQMYDIVSGRR